MKRSRVAILAASDRLFPLEKERHFRARSSKPIPLNTALFSLLRAQKLLAARGGGTSSAAVRRRQELSRHLSLARIQRSFVVPRSIVSCRDLASSSSF